MVFDALVYALLRIGGLWRDSLVGALVLVCGGVCSGTAWQPMLNAVSDAGMPFISGACAVGSVCGLFFWAGVSAGELVRVQAGEGSPRSKRREFLRALYFAATLSLAIAGAAACFVGTDAKYHGNFLQVGSRRASPRVCLLQDQFTTTAAHHHVIKFPRTRPCMPKPTPVFDRASSGSGIIAQTWRTRSKQGSQRPWASCSSRRFSTSWHHRGGCGWTSNGRRVRSTATPRAARGVQASCLGLV